MVKLENSAGNLTVYLDNQKDIDRHLEKGWHVVEQNKPEKEEMKDPERKAISKPKTTKKKAAKKQ